MRTKIVGLIVVLLLVVALIPVLFQGPVEVKTQAATKFWALMLDGKVDQEVLVVQGHSTQTNSLIVAEQSDGTDIFTVSNAGASWQAGNAIFEGSTADAYETTFSITDPTADRSIVFADGAGTVVLSSLATNAPDAANSVTGASNAWVFEGATADDFETSLVPTDPTADRTLTLPNVSGTVHVNESTQNVTGNNATLSGYVSQSVGTENIGVLPTIVSSAVVTTVNDGALFTITDGEIWIVHGMWINVTTNFDCTGDNCTLILGDGNDTDGFCVLADAELQAADTEATGFAAGWQCMAAATRGVYLDEVTTNAFTGGFIYAPSGADETIDLDVGGTDVVAGQATVYILYTRLQ